MKQNENQVTVADEQLHVSAVSSTEQSDEGRDSDEPSHEGMFFCTQKNHWVSRSQAAKKGDNPSICKVCSAKKREQIRLREEAEKAQKQASIDEIPPSEQRGETKRVTFSLTKYTVAALDILGVGKSTSEVVERAVIELLQQQDPQVIAFAGRIFQQ